MGAHMSTEKKAARRSMAIDKQIEMDWERMRKEYNDLVLGTRGSGKSTIVKRMKIMHHTGYIPDELEEFRLVIYTNLVDVAKGLILTMRRIGVDCVGEINRTSAEKILEYEVESDPSFRLAPDVANAIDSLWHDPVIATVMDHCSDPDLFNSTMYFLSQVQKIAQRDYIPDESDVLRARATTDGVDETKFQLGMLSIRVLDPGNQGSERKKWIHCFEAVTSLIFCAALSDYDQVLSEDNQQTRMAESLVLFEAVINSRWFLRTSIILFLTKIDLFKAKLRKAPMDKHFSEYTGGSDINKAAKYILGRYTQANRAGLSIYPQ
ncbi:Guanine nucleotide-binding protein alpha-2 subunit [Tulasnella sp. 424]|nr:Guanine nucleotide-binding protein alpha-2 subunit [Tulasnella sp. 424]